jgi:hypothetical protein
VASFRTYVLEGDAIAGQGTVSRPAEAAAPTKRPALPAARRPRRRAEAPAKVMLRCTEGCTFLRASRRSPIRCPSDRSRSCAVSPV